MKRDLKLDGLKFILIILVVFGHLPVDDYGTDIAKYIYAFHMPLFIFISGYVTPLKPTREKIKRFVIRMLCLYGISQAIHLVIQSYFGLLEPEIYNWFILPQLALWYIVSLLFWRLMTWGVFVKLSDIKLILLTVVLFFACGFVPLGHEFSFQRTFAFLPFFCAGLICKRSNWMTAIERTPIFIGGGYFADSHIVNFKGRTCIYA